MTPLQREALVCTALTKETVEDIYGGASSDFTLRMMCTSHERLRAELEGAEIMLADAEKMQARIEHALAMTDTGSKEFRETFSSAAPLGWNVVAKIREVLSGG